LKRTNLSLAAFCLLLIGISILVGTQLSYFLGYQKTLSVPLAEAGMIEVNPTVNLLLKLTWNTTAIEPNQSAAILGNLTNIGAEPVELPFLSCISSLYLFAANGSEIGQQFVDCTETGFNQTLLSNQSSTVLYVVGFKSRVPNFPLGSSTNGNPRSLEYSWPIADSLKPSDYTLQLQVIANSLQYSQTFAIPFYVR
jgi:hypothetical protein